MGELLLLPAHRPARYCPSCRFLAHTCGDLLPTRNGILGFSLFLIARSAGEAEVRDAVATVTRFPEGTTVGARPRLQSRRVLRAWEGEFADFLRWDGGKISTECTNHYIDSQYNIAPPLPIPTDLRREVILGGLDHLLLDLGSFRFNPFGSDTVSVGPAGGKTSGVSTRK